MNINILVLLLEPIIEIRPGDTSRNVLDELQTIKVAEYERDGERVCQTTELRDDIKRLLERLNVALPPKMHEVQSES